MASSRRAPHQGSRQMKTPKRSLPGASQLLRLVLATGVLCLIILAAVPGVLGDEAPATTPFRGGEAEMSSDDVDFWVSVVGEMEGSVDSALLMGGAGDNAALDALLEKRGVSRSEYQIIARGMSWAASNTDSSESTPAVIQDYLAYADLPIMVHPGSVYVDAEPTPSMSRARELHNSLVTGLAAKPDSKSTDDGK